MTDITVNTVACTFVSGWVSRFGIPSTVTTDRGRQFESHLWRALTEILGCHHLRTTAYHPSTNGMVERFHRQLKASLKAKISPHSTLSITLSPLDFLRCFTKRTNKHNLGIYAFANLLQHILTFSKLLLHWAISLFSY